MSDLPYSTQALFYSSRAMHIRGQSERGARSMANELASTYIAVVKERDFLRAERDALKARVAELVDTQNVLAGDGCDGVALDSTESALCAECAAEAGGTQ